VRKEGELLDDSRIIKLFFERSEQAIVELSEKYGRLCTALANNILNNKSDAEECVNDAYLGVWNTVPPQSPDSLSGYVMRIVRNLAVKKYRSNTAAKRNSNYDMALEEIEDCLASRMTVDDEADADEAAEKLNLFLETLDKESRALFVRRYWYADSIDNLAEAFSTSKHNISVRLSRIRKKLKKYLQKEGVLP